MNIKEKDKLLGDIKLADSLERLRSNADFKLLMHEINVVQQTKLVNSISGIVKNNDSTNTIFNELTAISFFNSYLEKISINGDIARDDLDQED